MSTAPRTRSRPIRPVAEASDGPVNDAFKHGQPSHPRRRGGVPSRRPRHRRTGRRNKAVAAPRRRRGVEAAARADQLPGRDHHRGRRRQRATCATELPGCAASPPKPPRPSGAQLLAVGLPPTVPHEFPITDTPRYREIAERFGMIAHEQGICGCHVHVAVPDRDAAIQVSNRLRPWLPLLLALTANSAVYRNADTGYASWRSVAVGALAQRRAAAAFRLRRRVRRGGADAAATRARCWTTAWSIGTSARRPTSRPSRCASPTCRRRWPRRCCWPR